MLAGSELSFRSYAVCIVNLDLKTSCCCHRKPVEKFCDQIMGNILLKAPLTVPQNVLLVR